MKQNSLNADKLKPKSVSCTKDNQKQKTVHLIPNVYWMSRLSTQVKISDGKSASIHWIWLHPAYERMKTRAK